MSEIQIIMKPARHGDYYIFHIPNKLIKNNVVDPAITYLVKLEPFKKSRKIKLSSIKNKEE